MQSDYPFLRETIIFGPNTLIVLFIESPWNWNNNIQQKEKECDVWSYVLLNLFYV